MKPSPNDRLLAVIRRLSPTEAQNRLMRISDREIAVSMMFMEARDREKVLALVAPRKAHLIREEFGFQKHLAVRYEQYLLATENVIGQLQHGSVRPPLRSYLRPRGRHE